MSDLLGDASPSRILATLLYEDEVFTPPVDAEDWPLYVSFLPDRGDAPDDAAAIRDTLGIKDGRLMRGGKNIFHHGVQLEVRARDYEEGFAKAKAAAEGMEPILRRLIAISGLAGENAYYSHRIESVTQTSPILYLGLEDGTKRRHLFTVNWLVTLTLAIPTYRTRPPQLFRRWHRWLPPHPSSLLGAIRRASGFAAAMLDRIWLIEGEEASGTRQDEFGNYPLLQFGTVPRATGHLSIGGFAVDFPGDGSYLYLVSDPADTVFRPGPRAWTLLFYLLVPSYAGIGSGSIYSIYIDDLNEAVTLAIAGDGTITASFYQADNTLIQVVGGPIQEENEDFSAIALGYDPGAGQVFLRIDSNPTQTAGFTGGRDSGTPGASYVYVGDGGAFRVDRLGIMDRAIVDAEWENFLLGTF